MRQLVAVQIVFWAAKHGSFSLLVFLCVLYSLFIKLDCQLPQDFNRRVCLLQRIVKQIFFPTEAKSGIAKTGVF